MTSLLSLLCVKLANHGNKSIVSGQIGYLLPHFSENVALTFACAFYQEIGEEMFNRDSLKKKGIKSGSQNDWSTFKKARNT